MSFETWLLFVVVSLVPVMSPGPGVLLAISNALRYGAGATMISSLGNSVGLVVLGLAVSFGLGALLSVSALAFLVFKIAGACYLIFLGIKAWRDHSSFQVDNADVPVSPNRHVLFWQAVLVALTNPKAIMIMAALFPQFMDGAEGSVGQVALLAFTYASLCFINQASIGFAGKWLKRFLASPRRMRWVRRSTGMAFVGFGAALAVATK